MYTYCDVSPGKTFTSMQQERRILSKLKSGSAKRNNAVRFFCLLIALFANVSSGFCQDLKKLHRAVEEAKDDTTKINALLNFAQTTQSNLPDTAFLYCNEALKMSRSMGYKKGLGAANNILGDLYWYQSDYSSSSDHYFEALKIFDEQNDKPAIASCYRNIGWVYLNQNNFQQAKSYFNKSLAFNLELKDRPKAGQNYNDLGIVMMEQHHYEDALNFLQKSLSIQLESDNKNNLVSTYSNIAGVYKSMGKLELAIANLKKSEVLSLEVGNKQNIAIIKSMLGEVYALNKNYKEALGKIDEAFAIANELHFKDAIKESYLKYAYIYSKLGDYQKAYYYSDLGLKIKDSIYNENNTRQINEMTAKYESEKKELEISALEKDKALVGEKLAKEKNFKLFLILLSLLIAGVAFVLFLNMSNKKKANKALSIAYQEIEIKNKDITDSINYSKKIQDASLPSKELQLKLFPASFIFFRPKDIVSGDFYWYAEKDNYKLIAACDCTGHGVPGALMSMIGNNLLNQIVIENNVSSPEEILNQLNRAIRKSLKQAGTTESRDGMDIALIRIKDKELDFAGAQRPLYILNKGELQEIKGDKYSIGGITTADEKPFSKTSLELEAGSCIYLFSDGYVDQFGGTSGKKFMTKNFKELLLKIHSLPMEQQSIEIESTLSSWQGNKEQVDDVLVIGIQIS